VRELLAIDSGEMKLPPKSVMITFDDGQESFYKYAYPLLLKYNFKAVLSVIGKYTEDFSKTDDHNIAYSHVTYNEIEEMIGSGLVEIGNHSYNFHSNSGSGRSGVTKMQGESYEDYEIALKKDINIFNEKFEKNLNYKPNIFTYPFGRYTDETEKIIKDSGFLVAFTCYEKRNVPKINDNWLYRLGRYNRSGKYSTEKFFSKALF
jgi:peptidoglycan/xylan/chitin deacetylase (PgdA/CDA1 family)